jgi:hypothetical protein
MQCDKRMRKPLLNLKETIPFFWFEISQCVVSLDVGAGEGDDVALRRTDLESGEARKWKSHT